MNGAQQGMWQMVRRKALGVKIHRQAHVLGYIADFWIPAARLVVELEGPRHRWGQVREYDADRDAALARFGIRTVRIPEQVVLDNPGNAVALIRQAIEARGFPGVSGGFVGAAR